MWRSSSLRRITWCSNIIQLLSWVNIIPWQQRVGFYQGLQTALLTELFSLVILFLSGELSWIEPLSVSLVSDEVQRFWKWSNILLLDSVFTSSLDRKWTTSWTHLEWPWLAAVKPVTEFPRQESCSCLKKSTVISRMSAFSILESGSCLRNSGPSRDLSCSMLLLIRSLRSFSTSGFLIWRKTKAYLIH